MEGKTNSITQLSSSKLIWRAIIFLALPIALLVSVQRGPEDLAKVGIPALCLAILVTIATHPKETSRVVEEIIWFLMGVAAIFLFTCLLTEPILWLANMLLPEREFFLLMQEVFVIHAATAFGLASAAFLLIGFFWIMAASEEKAKTIANFSEAVGVAGCIVTVIIVLFYLWGTIPSNMWRSFPLLGSNIPTKALTALGVIIYTLALGFLQIWAFAQVWYRYPLAEKGEEPKESTLEKKVRKIHWFLQKKEAQAWLWGLVALGNVTLAEIVIATGIASKFLAPEAAIGFFWAYTLWAGVISTITLLIMVQMYLNATVSKRLPCYSEHWTGWRFWILEILIIGEILAPVVTLGVGLYELRLILRPAVNMIGLPGIAGVVVALSISTSLIIFKAFIFCKAYQSEWR